MPDRRRLLHRGTFRRGHGLDVGPERGLLQVGEKCVEPLAHFALILTVGFRVFIFGSVSRGAGAFALHRGRRLYRPVGRSSVRQRPGVLRWLWRGG